MSIGENRTKDLPWLVGPARDVIFFLVPFIFCIALMAAFLGSSILSHSVPFNDALYLGVTFHVLLTFRLCGRDGPLRCNVRRLALAALILSVCVFVAVAEWYLNRHGRLRISSPSIALLYIVNAWNITAQSIYVIRLYRERAATNSPMDASLDCQLISVNAILFYGIGWFYLDQVSFLAQWRGGVFPFLFVLLALYEFILLVVIFQRRLRQWRADSRAALPVTALLSALIYPWPMFLVLWNPEPSLAWLTVPMYAHAVQYIALHFYVFPRHGGTGRFALQCAVAAGGAVILLVAMKLGGEYYGKVPVLNYCVQGIAMGFAALHTIGDGRLFRMSEQIGPHKS
ncbi:MAG: hypothetical protein ABI579_08755 [Candidatus Sumerlaeota bacterium]